MRNLAMMWVLAGVAVALLAAGDWKPPVSTFTDKRDGKVYRIVKIGSQVWFAENLNYVAEGSVCYENKAENCAKYGRLYSWETAMKACPAGFHLPLNEEWDVLVEVAGGENLGWEKLKAKNGWDYNGTNELGFSALPGGIGYLGDYYRIGYDGDWWSAASRYSCYTANRYVILYSEEGAAEEDFEPYFLRSVRCVLDDEKERRK